MWSRIRIGLTAALALLPYSGAWAQVTPGSDWTFEGYWHEYEEEAGGAFLMSNKGPFLSARYGYNWKSGSLFLRATPSLALGSVNYTSAGTGDIDNTFNFTIDGELRAGAELAAGGGTFFIPWVGLGYRMHYDDKGGKISSVGAAGYDRRSEYFYAPVGLTLSVPLGANWVMEPEAIYKFFLSGTQTSYLSDIDPGCSDLENDQDSGFGAEASLGFRTVTSSGMPITVGPFVRYWDIDDSDLQPVYCYGVLQGYGYEPMNTTTEIGVRFRLNF